MRNQDNQDISAGSNTGSKIDQRARLGETKRATVAGGIGVQFLFKLESNNAGIVLSIPNLRPQKEILSILYWKVHQEKHFKVQHCLLSKMRKVNGVRKGARSTPFPARVGRLVCHFLRHSFRRGRGSMGAAITLVDRRAQTKLCQTSKEELILHFVTHGLLTQTFIKISRSC